MEKEIYQEVEDIKKEVCDLTVEAKNAEKLENLWNWLWELITEDENALDK